MGDNYNFSVSQDTPIVVEPFEEEEIEVSFNPNQAGDLQTILTISGPEFSATHEAQIILKGTAINGTLVSGNVSGTWTKEGSPYIAGYISVPEGQFLTINPGVEILFDGKAIFNVYGALNVLGTSQDSVVITHLNPYEEYFGEEGIYFAWSKNPSIIQYCIIKDLNSRKFNYSYTSFLKVYSNVSFLHSNIGENCIEYIELGKSNGIDSISTVTFNSCKIDQNIRCDRAKVILRNCRLTAVGGRSNELSPRQATGYRVGSVSLRRW